MSNVERLPTQHRLHPHCPSCKADLPTFDDVTMIAPEASFKGVTIFGITYHIQCPCGTKVDLQKRALSEAESSELRRQENLK